MLILDMENLSHAALRQTIAERCADFGRATVIKVLTPDAAGEYGAAAVEMSDLEEADNLAKHYAGSRCGCKVIIRLAQEGNRLPNGLKRHLSPFAPAAGAYQHAQH